MSFSLYLKYFSNVLTFEHAWHSSEFLGAQCFTQGGLTLLCQRSLELVPKRERWVAATTINDSLCNCCSPTTPQPFKALHTEFASRWRFWLREFASAKIQIENNKWKFRVAHADFKNRAIPIIMEYLEVLLLNTTNYWLWFTPFKGNADCVIPITD